MSDTHVTREELYQDVWSRPLTKIAKCYGISDSALIKILKKLGIPRPGLGYWAKVAHGKKVKQKSLPKVRNDTEVAYWLDRMTTHAQQKSQKTNIRMHPVFERERLDKFKIVLRSSLEETLPITQKNIGFFEHANEEEQGILVPNAKTALDLRVSRETLERSLLITDALMRAFQRRGWSFKAAVDGRRCMSVIVEGEAIEFYLHEKLNRIDHVLTDEDVNNQGYWYRVPKYDYSPSGNLSLVISSPAWFAERQSWSDGIKRRIENYLNEFCAHLSIVSENIKKDRAKREYQEHLSRYAAENRKRIKVLVEAENQARKSLEEEARNWAQANLIRDYLRATETSGKEEWAQWANNYADLLDPNTQGVPSVIEVSAPYVKSHQ